VKVEKVNNLSQNMGLTAQNHAYCKSFHRLIHRNCGYPRAIRANRTFSNFYL